MCLKISEYRTNIYKNRKNPILVYKVVKEVCNKLFSPYQGTLIEINPETLEFSTNSSLNAERSFNEYEDGIHAFLLIKRAQETFPFRYSEAIIVRAWIYPEDILGVGSREEKDIVAKRIFFHKEDVE